MVPLGTLVDLREISGPISVTRYNLYSAAAITGNLQTGLSSGEAIEAVEKIVGDRFAAQHESGLDRADVHAEAGRQHVDSTSSGLSVVCVFLALAALYESWSLPLAVILVVPLCLLCSVAGVLITGRDVNIFVQIGLVVLVGAGVQERDPGRRVRPAVARARASRGSRRRWKHRGCGCGRS